MKSKLFYRYLLSEDWEEIDNLSGKALQNYAEAIGRREGIEKLIGKGKITSDSTKNWKNMFHRAATRYFMEREIERKTGIDKTKIRSLESYKN